MMVSETLRVKQQVEYAASRANRVLGMLKKNILVSWSRLVEEAVRDLCQAASCICDSGLLHIFLKKL